MNQFISEQGLKYFIMGYNFKLCDLKSLLAYGGLGQAKTSNLNPCPFFVFTFGLAVDYIHEFGGVLIKTLETKL